MTLARGKQVNGYVIFKEGDGNFVVRMRRLMGEDAVLDETPLAVTASLEDARAAIQNTDCLLRLPPDSADGPTALETWV